MACLQHFLDTGTQRTFCRGTVSHDFSIADDYTKQVIEVVSYSSRKPPNGFHLLRLTKLLFQMFTFRHVSIHDHQLLDLSGFHDCAGSGLERAPAAVLVPHAVFEACTLTAEARCR